jgi:hypothetical protein
MLIDSTIRMNSPNISNTLPPKTKSETRKKIRASDLLKELKEKYNLHKLLQDRKQESTVNKHLIMDHIMQENHQ